ncbi:MAG TPA: ABC transporter ATP-binding protein [Candidatus Limnocylindrales bacterium]|nr:ABC transporter ATP-binding protein [Candidatus Limnocylindrales bacterium]
MSAIDVRGLAKRYGRTEALVDLSFTVEQGEIMGFLGPNGAGKTTAVKLLVGLTRPSGGSGTVLGSPLGDRAARRRIGYLPELFRYQAWLTPFEVLALHARLADLPPADRSRAIGEVLEVVGLASRTRDRVGTLSKGLQQRLGLAVALLGRPELLILDEPTSALDPVGRSDVRDILVAAREAGTTILLDSHLLSEVERVCDRVVILDHGCVVAAGTPDELVRGRGIRLRVTDLAAGATAALDRFGPIRVDGDWIAIEVGPDAVPEVVASIVAAGGRIHEVQPSRGTLEDRFLSLVGHGPHS